MSQSTSRILPGLTGARRAPLFGAALSMSAVAALGATFLFTQPDLSPELMRPFTAIHGLLGSGMLAMLGYAALMGALWPLAQILGALEAVSRLAMAAGLAGLLPFAQGAGPDGGAASSARGGQAAVGGHEIQIGAYGGYNHTRPSKLHMVQPGGTDLTFTDLKWIGESFKTEPYWGVRTTYWAAKLKGIGLMFDYSHAKASALKTQELTQSGTRDGQDVPSSEPFSKTFRKLEFTHGLNFFTLNALYRADWLHARIAPYAGVGIGLSVPHVDTRRAGASKESRTYKHQITGLAFQALGGIEWRLLRSRRATAFTEYKLTYTSNEAELNGGGLLQTDLWTHQAPVGFSYHHWLGAR
ncbi:MAG: outer membrane protein [Methyloligellaceae bacterium]